MWQLLPWVIWQVVNGSYLAFLFNTARSNRNLCGQHLLNLSTPSVRHNVDSSLLVHIWVKLTDAYDELFLTPGHFWHSGIVVACVCLCMCACVNPEFVGAITCHLFKLESSNWDQKCKTPWLRSLLFLGWLTLTFKVKLNLKFKMYQVFICIVIAILEIF